MRIPLRGFAPWPSTDGQPPRPLTSTLSKTFPDPGMKVSGDIVASPELHLGGDGEMRSSLGYRSIATPYVDKRGRWGPDEQGQGGRKVTPAAIWLSEPHRVCASAHPGKWEDVPEFAGVGLQAPSRWPNPPFLTDVAFGSAVECQDVERSAFGAAGGR